VKIAGSVVTVEVVVPSGAEIVPLDPGRAQADPSNMVHTASRNIRRIADLLVGLGVPVNPSRFQPHTGYFIVPASTLWTK
jgi:hypothetical protein